jgi:amino acid transporter
VCLEFFYEEHFRRPAEGLAMSDVSDAGRARGDGPAPDLGAAPAPVSPPPTEISRHHLAAGAVSIGSSLIMGLASSGPTASIALTLAAIVAASHYAGPVAILVCFLPMLGIALAYRRLNMWRVDAGASYQWVGRAMTPYLGFMVGWVMLLAYLLGTGSDVVPIGPYVLQVIAPSLVTSKLASAISATVWLLAAIIVAYLGIRVTAWFQWLMAAVEYTIITVFAAVCLYQVFSHNPASVAFRWSWFSWHGSGGTTGLVGGILIAVYMYSGWDTSMYVSEETTNARVNPGRAVVLGVVSLAVMYSFYTFAFEGAVKQSALESHGANALAYIVGQLVGSAWGKVMVIAVLFSIVASTQTALVSVSRIALSMGSDRVLPSKFGTVNPRHRSPGFATLVFGGIALIAAWVYLIGSSSVQAAFSNVVSSVGLLFALFYAATGAAMAVYYRKLAAKSLANFLGLAAFPALSAGFLLWVAWKSVPGLGGWTSRILVILYVLLALGVILEAVVRWVVRSPYFSVRTEAYDPARLQAADPS